jgi:acetylornithine deacetylase/succinyl-diaminopimelate desuccinylase-like protein
MHLTTQQLNRQLDAARMAHYADEVLALALAIQAIPAPTFHEARRATYVMAEMERLGLAHVRTDAELNVYGYMAGLDTGMPAILLTAHTDTVFAAETDLSVRREPGIILGPGLGDNSIGVAGMLTLIRYCREQQIIPACPLWFVATSREEGLGDLGGMKTAYQHLASDISAVINLEGLAFGHVYNSGIAVRRYRVLARAEGGHSWLHFGRASAIHGLMELGSRICAIRPPEAPRTTYNIGMISGGTTINSIAAEAEFWLDLRSESETQLAALETQVMECIRASNSAGLQFTPELVGDRPAGYCDSRHPLVETALETLRALNITPTLETGSTDANVPLSHGCPAVTIGITRGGNAHRLDEYIEIQPIAAGFKQLIMLTLTYAQKSAEVR